MRLKLKKLGQKRKGFTLLEVVIASLILVSVTTILFSLTTNAHLTTLNITEKLIAQNIAQATMEDIMAQNNSVLDSLIKNPVFSLPNYPADLTAEPYNTTYHINTEGTTNGGQISLDSTAPCPDTSLTPPATTWQDMSGVIHLFNYQHYSFSRDITIKDTTPRDEILTKPINLRSYDLIVTVAWTLNSTPPTPQSLTITGTKTNVNQKN